MQKAKIVDSIYDFIKLLKDHVEMIEFTLQQTSQSAKTSVKAFLTHQEEIQHCQGYCSCFSGKILTLENKVEEWNLKIWGFAEEAETESLLSSLHPG